ncbi:MAG: OmpH family outer membrane protein [Thermodesulfobacteria bacterium]|nr:OmpH family outer membrane protein [Thermodesulfobacteriota bacterium]
MKKLYGTLLLILFFSFLSFGVSFAQETKIGVIDVKEIVNECKYGQQIMQKLQNRYDELRAKLQKMVKKLQDLKKEIDTKSSLWSKDVKEKKQKEYEDLLKKIKQLQQESEIQMQEYQQKLLQPLFKKLEKVLKDYAEKNGYDLIIEKKQPGIYYVSNKIDLTSEMIKLLDEMYEKEKGNE